MTSEITVISLQDVKTILSQASLDDLVLSQARAFRSLNPRPRLHPDANQEASEPAPDSSSSSPDQPKTEKTSNAEETDSTQCPARLSIQTPGYTQLYMPARIARAPSVIKIVSVPSAKCGKNGILGTNVQLNDGTGGVSHLVNSTLLTAVRTAVGSLVSSILAFSQNSQVSHIVVFGSGAQALLHAWLHIRHFGCTRLSVVLPSHAGSFSSNSPSDIDFERVLGTADLVCTCTPSTQPLFDADWIRPGTHIVSIGSYKPSMIELPSDLVRSVSEQGNLIVDSKTACLHEAGCLIQAGVEAQLDRWLELGDLLPDPDLHADLPSQCQNRTESPKSDISIFKSVGVGVQDVAITQLVVRLADQLGLGTKVAF
ncbi:NAD(P)-binding protein [Testicularia cyperi]|uniref:NAD(P)-binding protein n=1 Tax=Testicularia cyperi TaxID=1882483 RepID=A0A317XP64_9BASI|nr:NAD(P)-binding protein [Testicularia cyperi]